MKLTPQNKHQEHMVQVLLAKMQGIAVEYETSGIWESSNDNRILLNETYRIVPQPTPLPFSREMWAMIDPKWKWAAMDKDGKVCFYTDKPYFCPCNFIWNTDGDYCHSVLAINTEGVNWRYSLTSRYDCIDSIYQFLSVKL